jgi:hypothetical protein
LACCIGDSGCFPNGLDLAFVLDAPRKHEGWPEKKRACNPGTTERGCVRLQVSGVGMAGIASVVWESVVRTLSVDGGA